MRVICCSCGAHLKGKEDDPQVTHGLCKACAEDVIDTADSVEACHRVYRRQERQECPRCFGSGIGYRIIYLEGDARKNQNMPCPVCKGEGKVPCES